MKIAKICLIFFTIFLLGCNNYVQDRNHEILSKTEIIELGHKYANWFYSNQLDSLINCIVDKNYKLADLRDFREKVKHQLGEETECINERSHIFFPKDRFVYAFIRNSKFSKVELPVKTSFGFDRLENIYTFSVQAQPKGASTNYLDYQTKTKLRLPFDGEWDVASGGRSIVTNHHVVAKDQRFAYDFLIKRDNLSFQNKGKKNEDYYCYNKRLYAPGSGIVVTVKNDLPENKPGSMPTTSGNHVIIDHQNGEFSILSHFKQGTIVVKEKDKLDIGQFLGLCGNSGHSSEAHLHYHLQNTPVFFEGDGLPAQFQDILVNGKPVKKGEVMWNQKVQNSNQ